jgi:thioredoxin-like negative regulator of GroEL
MITLKSSNLEYYLSVLPSEVLLIFASPTCPLCREMVPQIEKQLGDQIEILYIDGDKWENIADQYNIDYYPTLILLEEGKEINRIDRVNSKNIKNIIK